MSFNGLMTAFWILDILNPQFMEMFDTTYPLNTLFWVLWFIFAPSITYVRNTQEEQILKNELEELKQWTWIARDLNGMLILSDGRLVKDTMLECWYQIAEEENESYKIFETELCSPYLDSVR